MKHTHLTNRLLMSTLLVLSSATALAQGWGDVPEAVPAKAVYDTNELTVDQVVELLTPDPREGSKAFAPSARWVSWSKPI